MRRFVGLNAAMIGGAGRAPLGVRSEVAGPKGPTGGSGERRATHLLRRITCCIVVLRLLVARQRYRPQSYRDL